MRADMSGWQGRRRVGWGNFYRAAGRSSVTLGTAVTAGCGQGRDQPQLGVLAGGVRAVRVVSFGTGAYVDKEETRCRTCGIVQCVCKFLDGWEYC